MIVTKKFHGLMLCNGLTIKIWEDGRCPVTPNFAQKALELRSGFDIID